MKKLHSQVTLLDAMNQQVFLCLGVCWCMGGVGFGYVKIVSWPVFKQWSGYGEYFATALCFSSDVCTPMLELPSKVLHQMYVDFYVYFKQEC